MRYAAITGLGKYVPPAVLTNDDLASFLDTSNEWIVTRTGICERRISHKPMSYLAIIAADRALAQAGLHADELDLIVLGSCTFDELLPNTSSLVQKALGAEQAACYDINTACTSFAYALSSATAQIRNGTFKNALVIGADCMSQLLDWKDRSTAVLFGDGAGAVVLENQDEPMGLLHEKLGCMGRSRDNLKINNYGLNKEKESWVFDGQEVFRRAVIAMARASQETLHLAGLQVEDVGLCIAHQANNRIVQAVAKKLHLTEQQCFVNVDRYGNTSAASIPIALTEAYEQGLMTEGMHLILPAFGAGLTWSSQYVKWGHVQHRAPRQTAIDIEPCQQTGLEIVNSIRSMR